jgi:hypothetical protein
MKKILFVAVFIFQNIFSFGQGVYIGSGSVTQGIGITTNTNIFPGCSGSRVSAVGTITSTDNKTWVVPAETNFLTGPYLSDLYNQCSGFIPTGMNGVNLNSIPVTTVNQGGDTITAYILGDNYFELYINGVLIGVDPVPYTPFNASVTKFVVSRPYTIAMKLVDWEENLGLGSENNNGNLYHSGDGGLIAVFSDGTVTDATWKAQTFYVSPIDNLNNIVELPDSTRSSANATVSPTCNANCFGIHYEIPNNWNAVGFNDNAWPLAHVYSPATVGVNFPAYNNFTSIWTTGSFIWSSNLVLDNIVLIRKVVPATTSINNSLQNPSFNLQFENNMIDITSTELLENVKIEIVNSLGQQVLFNNVNLLVPSVPFKLSLNNKLSEGVYILKIYNDRFQYTKKFKN